MMEKSLAISLLHYSTMLLCLLTRVFATVFGLCWFWILKWRVTLQGPRLGFVYSFARGGSWARIYLDTEHLEMLKYLILMIHGGRMKKGKKDSLKFQEERGSSRKFRSLCCCACCIFWIISADLICWKHFFFNETCSKRWRWFLAEVQFLPAGSYLLCQSNMTNEYFQYSLSTVETYDQCVKKLRQNKTQYILSLSLFLRSVSSSVFFSREQRMRKWPGIFIAFSSINVSWAVAVWQFSGLHSSAACFNPWVRMCEKRTIWEDLKATTNSSAAR